MDSAKGQGDGSPGGKSGGKAAKAPHDSPWAEAENSLYRVPLSEFTPARNSLVTRLKKGGRTEEASRIKGLVKPSIPAWAVNQLFWHHRPQFDALLAVGERFRTAQTAQLQGRPTDLRGPLEERREALSTLTKLAAASLTSAGHSATPDTMRRITSTLEAISVLGSGPDAPPAGRLIDDVDPPGFEALAALVPRVGGDDEPMDGPSRVLTFRQQHKAQPKSVAPKADQQKAQLKSAQAAVQEAEQALRAARKDAERAEAALKQAAMRSKEAERARAEAERRLEKATTDAENARQHARKTAAAAEEAAQAIADAERAIDKAKQELAGLKD
jgi:hypothetical protein